MRFLFDKAERHPYLVPVILVLFLLLLPSWLRPIHTPDEGRYAEVSREVLANGHWLVPHINGVPHLTKPPLYYDLAAVAFFLFGSKHFKNRHFMSF